MSRRKKYIEAEVFADQERPETIAAIEAQKDFKDKLRRRKKVEQKNRDLVSLRCSAILKLNQARRFQEFDHIYFPYNFDFRGRACKVVAAFSTPSNSAHTILTIQFFDTFRT